MLSVELEALRAVDIDLELKGFDSKALEDLTSPEGAQATVDDQDGPAERQDRPMQCPACGQAFGARAGAARSFPLKYSQIVCMF